jgi:soluble lytic murein transglycosylase
MSVGAMLISVLMIVFGSVFPAYADIYRYVDKNGVMHFTNAPTTSSYKLYRKDSDYGLKSYSYKGGGYLDPYTSQQYDNYINMASQLHGLPPNLVKAVIKVESNFNARAVSPKGAQGLMQLMPGTARLMNVDDPFDPWENISGGVRYLRGLIDRFEGKVVYALAGYNAGPEHVERYNGIPPFEETQTYVRRVIQYYQLLKNGKPN